MLNQTIRVPLHRLAHGRTGDKGDTSNISVIAYAPEMFPFIVAQVTETKVWSLFRQRQPSQVQRYVLPKLHALNYVLHGALDGGVNQSLNLDAHGKTLSFLLLSLEIEIPIEMTDLIQRGNA